MTSMLTVTAIHGVGSAELRPGTSVGPRVLTDWEVSLVVAGRGRWEAAGESVVLQPGDLLVAPPDVRERLIVDEEAPLHHLFIHLLLAGPVATLPRHTSGVDTGIVAPLMRHAVHLASQRAPCWRERASDALGLLLRAVANGSFDAPEEPLAPLHPAVVAALNHLRTRWRARLVAVEAAEMAHMAGISREHLTRLFRAAFGVGPGEAERLLRLDRAVDWLITSDLSVPDIAHRAGWLDAQRFSRAMRLASGRGPRELRQAWREGRGVRQAALSRLAPLRTAVNQGLLHRG